MHFAIACVAMSVVFVSGRSHRRGDLKTINKNDYEYMQYDLELVKPSMKRKVITKVRSDYTASTHRKIEIIITDPTTAKTTSEGRKLRYNEKVFLPLVPIADNYTVEPHQGVPKNNISVELMSAVRTYHKEEWTQVCEPLTGTAHPIGPLDYFDVIQAMRPPNFFPASDEGQASVKFFGEARYPVKDPSIKTAMTTFLRCLLAVIAHVADDSKRRKMARMFVTSMIGWLKDSLLVDLYSLPDPPDQTIIAMEDTVEALIYMRNRQFVPSVAKEALKTYEFISDEAEDDRSVQERQASFRITTAIMISVGVAFLFMISLLAACVAAALSSSTLELMNELPDDLLPLDHRQSQLMDRTERSGSLPPTNPPGVAVPAGHDQQVRKLSALPNSSLASKVRRTSMKAIAEQEQLSPLLKRGVSPDDDSDGSTGPDDISKGGSTRRKSTKSTKK